MDIGAFFPLDTRRLEVVVDGLPLFRSAQIAVDTTLVLAAEVGGRFSAETSHPERSGVRQSARSPTGPPRPRTRRLLLDRVPNGVDGLEPSVHEVMKDERHLL